MATAHHRGLGNAATTLIVPVCVLVVLLASGLPAPAHADPIAITRPPPWGDILTCMGLAVLIEVPIVALLYPQERGRMAAVALAVNVVTSLALNLTLYATLEHSPTYDGAFPPIAAMLGGEAIVFLVEAVTYILASRAHRVRRAVVASGLANLASFALGLALAALIGGP